MTPRSRTGKIAQLPAAVREELNQRILDGQQSPQLVAWLNGLPEVRQILGEHFEGRPVLQQNLSEWRLGGYADWQFKRDHVEAVKKLAEHQIATAQAAGKTLAQSVAEATAEEMTHVLSDLARARKAAQRRAARLPAPAGDPACGMRSRPGPACPGEAGLPEEAEEEDGQGGRLPDALLERFEVLNKASSTAARLRRLEQADTGLQLRSERQALTARIHAERQAQTLKIQTERLAFQIRVHEDKMSLVQAARNGNATARRRGMSDETIKDIDEKLHMKCMRQNQTSNTQPRTSNLECRNL